MIIPIVTSLSREVIATVPRAQREAAYGMGATRWEMIRYSVLPWSRGGITGAVMLGLGRAMGETIAVALVIGSQAEITSHLFSPGDSMAAVVANQWGESSGVYSAALIGLGMAVTPHARALRDLSDRVEVTHAYSPTPARRDAFSRDFDFPLTDRLETILEDRSVDAVLILTPPNTHLDLVRRCAAAGKHILLEKPVEITTARAEAIARAAKHLNDLRERWSAAAQIRSPTRWNPNIE